MVEFRGLDRFDQPVAYWKIRYYMRSAGQEGFKIEMMEDIEVCPIAPPPQVPYAANALH